MLPNMTSYFPEKGKEKENRWIKKYIHHLSSLFPIPCLLHFDYFSLSLWAKTYNSPYLCPPVRTYLPIFLSFPPFLAFFTPSHFPSLPPYLLLPRGILHCRKHMIGEPTNFLHVSHAGFDRDHNFSQFNVDKMVDDELKDFFRAVSV